jgi:formamidopyrimidine-DNA glycosylase
MPELPDITVYAEALARRVVGETLERVRLASPFLLRSVEPPLAAAEGRRVLGVRRLGKRIVLELETGLFLVLHLMIAGRLRWRDRSPPDPENRPVKHPMQGQAKAPPKVPGRIGLGAFDFSTGTLLLTEAGSKKRASLHLVRGEAELAAHDPGGLEVLAADLAAFREALASESHTLKRALTDPHLFSGIGNAYSDEILHRARLSPFKLTGSLSPEESGGLFRAARAVLIEWTERSRREVGEGFPGKVTAFRPGMAVHGRYREPCPVCGAPVQRILYAGNEANYCPRCQTGGKLLADRVLSRLLKG